MELKLERCGEIGDHGKGHLEPLLKCGQWSCLFKKTKISSKEEMKKIKSKFDKKHKHEIKLFF